MNKLELMCSKLSTYKKMHLERPFQFTFLKVFKCKQVGTRQPVYATNVMSFVRCKHQHHETPTTNRYSSIASTVKMDVFQVLKIQVAILLKVGNPKTNTKYLKYHNYCTALILILDNLLINRNLQIRIQTVLKMHFHERI